MNQKLGKYKRLLKSSCYNFRGKGTRLSSITDNIPKALWQIEGKHTFERTISILAEQGINYFILLLDTNLIFSN